MPHVAFDEIRNRYDHIIVGGGSAGCVVAARLSEEAARRILLIEAGDPDIDRPSMVDPGAWSANLGSDADWQYRTVPQQTADGRIFDCNRGKVLGGSSTINAMVWVWGHSNDFDAWADHGGEEWSFANLQPVFQRIETVPHRYRNGRRGMSGPMQLSCSSEQEPLAAAFLAACRECGHAVLDDVNGPIDVGVGTMNFNIKDGQRFSVAKSYLLPALERPNLSVLTHALVESLKFEGVRCVGVRCRIEGRRCEIRSDSDIVLSAGAIDSPRLLMISGVGNAEHLRSLGIAVVSDLPGVGENLHDHCIINAFSAETDELFAADFRDRMACHLFMRSSDALLTPDIQILFSPGTRDLPNVPQSKGFALVAGLVRPLSRGRLVLESVGTQSRLRIDPRYLSDPSDLNALCIGVEECTKLGSTGALSSLRSGAVRAAPFLRTELQKVVRRDTKPYWHPVGTCAMGSGEFAVVDSSLRVHGISNLRVADSSVMPTITTGNTLAPTLVIAEKGVSLIVSSP